jgi:hypothetical protein
MDVAKIGDKRVPSFAITKDGLVSIPSEQGDFILPSKFAKPLVGIVLSQDRDAGGEHPGHGLLFGEEIT